MWDLMNFNIIRVIILLEKKIPFLMHNLLKKFNKTSNNEGSKILIKSFSGILPKQQLKELNLKYIDNKNHGKIDYNIPSKEKDYISKQCSVRKNLITEVDINEIDKKSE